MPKERKVRETMIKQIAIVGGDLRLVKLSEMLVAEGAEVFTYALENAETEEIEKCSSLEELIETSDIILGPIPFSSNGKTINTPFSSQKIGVEELISLCSGKTLIAGGFRQEVYALAEANNVKLIDLLKREELSVLNAVSTAEGAIKIAIEETPKNLHGSNVLVMGFGRIGKILSHMLQGLGAKVACEARKNADLAWIKAYGYEPIPLPELEENLARFDVIINTIPYMILDRDTLDFVRKDTLVMDLASNPGGVDRTAVKEKKINFVWALSLPGKIAPVTSAEFIKETLYNIVKEIS